MIKFVELECPNCGSKLNMINDREAICSYCGATFLIDNDTPQPVINNIYTNNSVTKKRTIKQPIFFLLFAAFIFIYILIFYFTYNTNSDSTDNNTNNNNQSMSISDYNNQYKDSSFTSNLFKTFVSNVYGKSSEYITKDELSKITYISIYQTNDIYTIDYRLNSNQIKSEELISKTPLTLSDLKNFTGLKTILLNGYRLSNGDLDGLNEITALKSINSPKELSEIIEKPEKIKTLSCNFTENSTIGIDSFKNLTKLTLDNYNLTDINALSALKNLVELNINADTLSDFSVLKTLQNIKHLSINAPNLKDISFLSSLKKLSEFELYNSNVIDITSLSNITDLKKLVLYDNYKIKKYDTITLLNNLTELTLSVSSRQTQPDIGRLSNIKKLEISGFDSISFLKKLPNLTELSISGSSCSEYNVFSLLKNLKTLKLTNIYGDIYDLDFLKNMEKLTSLNIGAMSVYGNAEAIFNIPNLMKLNIDNCSMGLDFTNISKNKNLKILHMNNIKIMKNIKISYDGIFTNLDYDNVNLEDNISFLSNFPNLTELYTQGNELTNVDFTSTLKKLTKLDITDNYITDLRPLGKLKELSIVWCGENSISQGLDLGTRVTVLEDSKASSK